LSIHLFLWLNNFKLIEPNGLREHDTGKGISVIGRRIVEDEGKRGIVRIVPLAEKVYLRVAFLYLKEQRFNPAIKTFVQYREGRGRRMIKT